MENKDPDNVDYVLKYPTDRSNTSRGQSVLLYRPATRGTLARRLKEKDSAANVGLYGIRWEAMVVYRGAESRYAEQRV